MISVTITDIWNKFGTEHKYHTTNTPEWPHSHKLKIQDGGGRHLEFRKMSIHKNILHQIIWEDASRPCGDNHVAKSQNRKLIRVTSSTKSLKHMCVDLGDNNRHLNQIWYRTQIIHYQRRNGQIHINWKSKMAAAAILNLGKMSITLHWIKISCIKLYGKMPHGHAEMTTWPKVETGS